MRGQQVSDPFHKFAGETKRFLSWPRSAQPRHRKTPAPGGVRKLAGSRPVLQRKWHGRLYETYIACQAGPELLWRGPKGFSWLYSGVGREVPTHEFFKCARWQTLLRQGRIVADDSPVFQIEGQVKNYDQEIRKLCDWLSYFLSSDEEGNVVGTIERLEFMSRNDMQQLAVHEGSIIVIH